MAGIGPLAEAVYRDWDSGQPPYRINPLEASAKRLGEGDLVFEDGCDLVALRSAEGKWGGFSAPFDPALAAIRSDESDGEVFRLCDWGWGNATFRSASNGKYLTAADRGIEASAPEVWGWYVKERFSIEAGGAAPADGAAGRDAAALRTWEGRPVGLDAERGLVALPEGARPEAFTIKTLRDGKEAAVRAAAAADTALVFVGNHPLLAG